METAKVSLDSLANALRPESRRIGEMTARTLFEGRGNKSEAHLSEFELAAAIATGVEVALLRVINGVQAEVADGR